MNGDPDNPFPNLSELLVWLSSKSDDKKSLVVNANLRLGAEELEVDEDIVFQVRAFRAYLSVSTSGLEIDKNNKFGERIRTGGRVKSSTIEQSESKLYAKANGDFQLGVDGLNATLGIGAGKTLERGHLNVEEMTEERTIEFVRPIGNNNWEISDFSSRRPLDGSFLYNTTLCRANLKLGANRSNLMAIAYVKQRDLDIVQIDQGHGWNKQLHKLSFNRNKERLIGILIAKSLNSMLSKNLEATFTGIVTLSSHEVEHCPDVR